MSLLEDFRLECESFLEAHDMAARDFGLQAVNDTGFMTRLRGGRSPTLNTIERVRAFMSAHRAKKRRAA